VATHAATKYGSWFAENAKCGLEKKRAMVAGVRMGRSRRMSRVLQIIAASSLIIFGFFSGPLRMVATDSAIDVAAAQTPPPDATPDDSTPKAKAKTTAKKKVDATKKDAAKKKIAAKKKAAPKDVDTTPPERN
jgi:hypothetical protein